MSRKDQVHSLVDKLPASELRVAQRFLEYLCASNGYDEPLTAEEAVESDAAWRAYLEGKDPGQTLEQVRRELL